MRKLPAFLKRKSALMLASVCCSGTVAALEPTVVSESFAIPVDGELRISAATLLSNDRGENGTGHLEVEFLDDWYNGSARYDRASGSITFIPESGFSGVGGFTYTVFDGLERGWGFVTVAVEEPVTQEPQDPVPGLIPNVQNDEFTINMNTTLETTAAALLANDRGQNGTGVLRVEFLDDWINGVATYDRDTGRITFSPENNFVGTGTFTYEVTDGIEKNWGFVSVTVEDGAVVPPPPNPEPPQPGPEPEPPAPGIEERDRVRQFTFNHSLWDHASSAYTNTVTGYWVGEFALASGTTYAWNGQFGQLDYHNLPPFPQLGSTNSSDVFPSENADFGELDLDNVLIMPPNFVQTSSASVSENDIANARRVIDHVAEDHSDIPLYIYEHWPEASSDVLNPSQWQAYNDLTRGEYHQWFLNYQNRLVELYPDADVRMIPVGPIIAEILQNSSLQVSALSFSELYEDNAPHGTTNLYFLAGLITYQAMYGQMVNGDYQPPVDSYSGVDRAIADDFAALNNFVWQRLNDYNSNGVRIWSAE